MTAMRVTLRSTICMRVSPSPKDGAAKTKTNTKTTTPTLNHTTTNQGFQGRTHHAMNKKITHLQRFFHYCLRTAAAPTDIITTQGYQQKVYTMNSKNSFLLVCEQEGVVRDSDAEVSTSSLELLHRPRVQHHVLLVGMLNNSGRWGRKAGGQ